MILKGSQRGGALQLARHLLRTDENDHVEVHELRGFSAETLTGALQETVAIAKGTRCQQLLFSLSLNPPENESVPVEVFEDAISKVEQKLGLENQARAIVFHEKDGRRHAHAVWSRIDVEEMKAINLPHYKLKLKDLSKELFLEHGWRLPEGLQDKTQRNPLNFTREEWQQAKRAGQDPRALKSLFQECWSVSDNQASFARALEERGFYLAQGRRGFVALDYRGEIYAVSKWTGQKAKDVRARLGDPSTLPIADQTKEMIAQRMTGLVKRYIGEVETALEAQTSAITFKKGQVRLQHRAARQQQTEQQTLRETEEAQARAGRFRKGFGGLWDWVSGKSRKIKKQNEIEAQNAKKRDERERESLIAAQLEERRALQTDLKKLQHARSEEIARLREDVAHYTRLGGQELQRDDGRGDHDRSAARDVQRSKDKEIGRETYRDRGGEIEF